MRQKKDDRRFAETKDEAKRNRLRDICDKGLEAGKESISQGLPDFILDVTDLIQRSRTDPTCIFHKSHDPLGPDYLARIRAEANEAAAKAEQMYNEGRKCDVQFPLRASYVDSDDHVRQLQEEITAVLNRLWDLVDDVGLFIDLNTPAVEEGSVAHSEVQDKIYREASNLQAFCSTVRTSIETHATGRGNLVAAVLQWPGIVDHRIALLERDQQECESMRKQLIDCRYRALTWLDGISKNYKKLMGPSKADSANMY